MSVSVVITVAALLVTYAVKGIYPFGSGNILGGILAIALCALIVWLLVRPYNENQTAKA